MAFVLVRAAGLILVTRGCSHPSDSSSLLGLSSAQQGMAAVTIVCAVIAATAAIVSWKVWRQIRGREVGQAPDAAFWALGGLFLSAIFFFLIVLTGGLALGLSAPCAS